jgi:hypothetical protein
MELIICSDNQEISLNSQDRDSEATKIFDEIISENYKIIITVAGKPHLYYLILDGEALEIDGFEPIDTCCQGTIT